MSITCEQPSERRDGTLCGSDFDVSICVSMFLIVLAALGYLAMSAVGAALAICYLDMRRDDEAAIAGLVWPLTLLLLAAMGICAVLLRIARRIERWLP